MGLDFGKSDEGLLLELLDPLPCRCKGSSNGGLDLRLELEPFFDEGLFYLISGDDVIGRFSRDFLLFINRLLGSQLVQVGPVLDGLLDLQTDHILPVSVNHFPDIVAVRRHQIF